MLSDRKEVQHLTRELAKTRLALKEAREALKDMEWKERGDDLEEWEECPSCDAIRRYSGDVGTRFEVGVHYTDCKLAKVLGEGEGDSVK